MSSSILKKKIPHPNSDTLLETVLYLVKELNAAKQSDSSLVGKEFALSLSGGAFSLVSSTISHGLGYTPRFVFLTEADGGDFYFKATGLTNKSVTIELRMSGLGFSSVKFFLAK